MRKADKKSGNLNFLEPSGPLQACNGTALPFLTFTFGRKKAAWHVEGLCMEGKVMLIWHREIEFRIRSSGCTVRLRRSVFLTS